jgi:hypothetical protein
MTAGRFEPYDVADAQGQGGSQTESWEQSGTWEEAEAWDYDEARANSEAYDELELRLRREHEQGPRFDRFQAAIADAPPPMADLEVEPRARRRRVAGWLHAGHTGRFWLSALWLVGAAGAGMLAGLVSTDLVALALNSGAASEVAAPSMISQATTPAAPTRVAGQPALAKDDHPAIAPIASPPPLPPEVTWSEIASRTVESTPPVAARIAAPPAPAAAVPAMPAAGPTRPATVAATEPDPAVADVTTAPADRQPAPAPPPAASEARVTTPLAPAAAPAPGAEYRVQLALLRDKHNAKYVWQDFVAKFGPSARDLHRYVFPTRTAHGTRHLVQVGPFADETHAEAMCEKLKERGGDCLVVRQSS